MANAKSGHNCLQVTTTTRTIKEVTYLGPDGQPIDYLPSHIPPMLHYEHNDYQNQVLSFFIWKTMDPSISRDIDSKKPDFLESQSFNILFPTFFAKIN